MWKYSSGSRGRPAKALARITVARVQIPPSTPNSESFLLSLFFYRQQKSPAATCGAFDYYILFFVFGCILDAGLFIGLFSRLLFGVFFDFVKGGLH